MIRVWLGSGIIGDPIHSLILTSAYSAASFLKKFNKLKYYLIHPDKFLRTLPLGWLPVIVLKWDSSDKIRPDDIFLL